ncbi:hypothetical protein TRIATDRAFT_287714 [Trichoderma atroviride IMI 206040]|uniref:Uncharacterized protein n=1 Tax=Hypocrea atroviridis (strain ATCC 20476 / IMI 206040) TaxID=452589 RepID=G9PAE0_HYPAI|nr:uncharacterized protein TRIATDRAFT_287714 [Trichoderma atroviride IMI 206040]EHK39975.1 hypothetical protein TRIATDRAFT_287714 [Trichoderma atroviride IMI 206040]
MLAAQAFSMKDNSRRHDTLSTASNAMRQRQPVSSPPAARPKDASPVSGAVARVRPRENSRSAGAPSATRQKARRWPAPCRPLARDESTSRKPLHNVIASPHLSKFSSSQSRRFLPLVTTRYDCVVRSNAPLKNLVADSRRDHVLLRRVCPSTEQALARPCTRCMQERDTPGGAIGLESRIPSPGSA